MSDRNYYYYSLFFPSGKIELGYLTNITFSDNRISFDLVVKYDDHNWLEKVIRRQYEQHTVVNLPLRLKKVQREDVLAHMMVLLANLKESCKHKIECPQIDIQLAQFNSEEELLEKIQKYVK